MELVAGLIKLLGSAGFGTIFGGVMGYWNRKVELQYKQLEYEDKDKQRAHELAQRKADAEIMEKEWAGRAKVATIEGEATIEAQAYNAMAESYKFAVPEKGTKMAAFSTFVRPFISLAYFLVSSAGSVAIVYYAFMIYGLKFTNDQMFELVMFVISWVAFMAGTTIGWWYASRMTMKPPQLR